MKHIAIFIMSLRSGGAEKQACMLAKLLSYEHMDVTFISFRGKEGASPSNLKLLEDGRAIKIPHLTGTVPSRLNQVRKIIKEGKFDILLNYLTFCDIYGAIFGRLYNVPLVVGGIRNSALPTSKYLGEKIIHNHLSHYTIFNSHEGLREFVRKGFRKDKSYVIPNCIDIPDIDFPEKKPDAVKTIITVGRFVEQKDYPTALEAIKMLTERRNDFKYIIVGYGDLEDTLRDMVEKMGLSRIVDIYIRPDNIPDLLAHSDIYLSTSLFEGTSNSIMEALLYRLPIVATNVGDNSSMVKEGMNGMLHECKNPKGIADSLDTLLDAHDLRTRYGIQSQTLLKEKYSVETFRKRYLEFLDKHPL